MEGFIKLHRQITENKYWFAERFTKSQAWIDLLILANHKGKTFFVRGNEVELERGQLGYAITTLAKRWKWNERTVDKFLSMLQKDEMIHYRKSPITTIISIKNYDLYQSNTEQNTEQSKNRIQTNKNVKECKRINKAKKNLFSIENLPLNLNGELFYKNKFFYITQEFKKELMQRFSNKNFTDEILENEFYKMEVWLEANEKKKNYKLFITNWLGKCKANPQQRTFNFSFNPIGKLNEQKN